MRIKSNGMRHESSRAGRMGLTRERLPLPVPVMSRQISLRCHLSLLLHTRFKRRCELQT